MKAAVITGKGQMPRYVTDFPEPIPANDDEVLITIKAAAVKQLDKSKASGKHYSETGNVSAAKVPGGDGVGLLADGTRVFVLGLTGTLAEKALAKKEHIVQLPDGIDDCSAAALPNAVAGSAMALRYRAAIQAGDTVLINGATGFTGQIAVQLARHYGAKKIIATGRNEQTLASLHADETIALEQPDESIIAQINHTAPIDIVIDYLWGHSAELILEALKGHGGFTPRTRFVSVGTMQGDKIQLSSAILRSTDLQLSGSGLGSWTRQEMQELLTVILPETLQLAADGKLTVPITSINLQNIEQVWNTGVRNGSRLVVTI